MKSIWIAGACIMAGATIYGFVDYEKKNQDKAFKQLYQETPVVKESPVVAVPKEVPVTQVSLAQNEVVKPEKTTTPVKHKSGKKKRFSLKLYSRAPLEEKYIKK